MNIQIFKIISFFGIFCTGLLGGFLSIKLSSSKNSERNFSLANVFAGGVFFGAGLIHMFSDSQEGFEAVLPESAYLLASIFCSAGFLLVLFLEKAFVHDHNISKLFLNKKEKQNIYPYILALVLSLHSIIAGIALGTETEMAMAFIILLAIIVHKGSAAFALGVSFIRNGVKEPIVMKTIAFFSFMTPVGIIIGSILTALLSGKTEQILVSIFDGLAAGTFLYVAIIDIIHEEFEKKGNRILKFVLLIIGLALMAILSLWT